MNHTKPILGISTAPPVSPPASGQLLLYNRSVVKNYKADGHQWVRKKNSKKVREDHVKLRCFRVRGKYRVAGTYVHSSTCGTFHRRAYHLLHSEKGTALYPVVSRSEFLNGLPPPSLVLVHYLDTTLPDTSNDVTYSDVTYSPTLYGTHNGGSAVSESGTSADTNGGTVSFTSGSASVEGDRVSINSGASSASLATNTPLLQEIGSPTNVLEANIPKPKAGAIQPKAGGIQNPGRFDVLFGRRGVPIAHPHHGNVTYRKRIKTVASAYSHTRKHTVKASIISDIIRQVKADGGKFLQQDENDKLWYEVDSKNIKSNTRQRVLEISKNISIEPPVLVPPSHSFPLPPQQQPHLLPLSPQQQPLISDIWTRTELEKLKDALLITDQNDYPSPEARREAIAAIVGTRDDVEVENCYKEVLKYTNVDSYIYHVYGRDSIANGIAQENITDTDVIFGQGVNIIFSPYKGMKRQLELIREYAKQEILAAEIARRVVHTLLGGKLRFLLKDKKFGDPINLYYPIEDTESIIVLTTKRVELVLERDRQNEALRRHIADMERVFPAPPGGRPTLREMMRDFGNNQNNQRVIERIQRNMYVAGLNEFGMNQNLRNQGVVGNQCTFCPIPPGNMEKVHDDTGQECIKPYMQMNEETRGERHLEHIEYEQLVLQNDQRGTIDRFASGIGPNDSHNFSWWTSSYLRCSRHGLANAVERRLITNPITGAIFYMHFKFSCDQTQRMTRAPQNWPNLREFRLSDEIIIVDFVWRVRVGGATGVTHRDTIVDCIRINGVVCNIRIREPGIVQV